MSERDRDKREWWGMWQTGADTHLPPPMGMSPDVSTFLEKAEIQIFYVDSLGVWGEKWIPYI